MTTDHQPLPVIGEPLFGSIPAGWTRDGFIAYLKHMIQVSRPVRPDRAEFWAAWLEAVQAAD